MTGSHPSAVTATTGGSAAALTTTAAAAAAAGNDADDNNEENEEDDVDSLADNASMKSTAFPADNLRKGFQRDLASIEVLHSNTPYHTLSQYPL